MENDALGFIVGLLIGLVFVIVMEVRRRRRLAADQTREDRQRAERLKAWGPTIIGRKDGEG
jgi:heme exporter protein D